MTLYPFTPRKMAIGDHQLSYIDQGSGMPVLMIHGNPTWSFYYRNLACHLQKKYRSIALDHLGCGLSDKPQDYSYTLENHIDNLSAFIEGLNLDNISLVMHDWGGAIGMGFAGRHPEKIRSLTVLNTAAFTSSKIPMRISLCRMPLFGTLLLRGLNAFSRAAIRMAVVKPMPAEVASGYLAPYDSWRNRVAVNAFVKDIPLNKHHVSWPTLREVENNLSCLRDIPMQIIWGGRDFCFNDYFYEEWRHRFPKADHHYFPDAGHYVLEDAFARIALIFDDFYGAL